MELRNFHQMRKSITMPCLEFEEMFDKVVMLKDDSPRDEAIKEIIKTNNGAGLRRLGQGGYASVFQNDHDSGMVYKIGCANENEGYLSYVRVAMRHQSNPHFPKFGKMTLFINKKMGRAHFLIGLERLTSYPDVTDGLDRLPDCFDKQSYYNFIVMIRDEIETDAVVQSQFNFLPPSWMQAVSILRDVVASRNVRFDLSTSNFMFRSPTPEGLVITDPLV